MQEDVRASQDPDLPFILSAEHRANASSHMSPKTLPAIYFHHINTSLEEPHLAEVHLKKAADLVPGCHIAWRLLGLLLSQPGPSSKATLAERFVEDLAPLSYFAKVVELLPKDVSTWWLLARSLYSLEEECVSDEKLRSQIFVTVNSKKYSSWDCFARVLELEPNVPKFWFFLGQSLLRSHHPVAKEECVVNIAFEGGPTMTEVSARYCYEAYIRISPPTDMLAWLNVAREMLNEREVTADVDDAFTTIEVDNGATTLTRPGMLARIAAVAEPAHSYTWQLICSTLDNEPHSYRLPLKTLMTINGVTMDSLSAQECLIHAIEMNANDAYSWILMFGILHRRDTMQAALHKVCPHPDDNSTHNKAPPSTCVISGKTYTKIDCVLMAHQLTVILAEDKKVDESENTHQLMGVRQEEASTSAIPEYNITTYYTWISVAVLAGESPRHMFTLPKGELTLPLTSPLDALNSGNGQVYVFDALRKSLEHPVPSCEDYDMRLLHFLRENSNTLVGAIKTWKHDVISAYERIARTCVLGCVHCNLLIATISRLSMCAGESSHHHPSPLSSSDAYLSKISMTFKNYYREADEWYELGRVLQPGHKVTLFLNDSTSQEYTRIDCFQSAIESPKRWNRAAAWLALGHELKSGDTVVIYGKHHTRDDCFKQARMWFDEKPSDHTQLTRGPPMDTRRAAMSLRRGGLEESETDDDVVSGGSTEDEYDDGGGEDSADAIKNERATSLSDEDIVDRGSEVVHDVKVVTYDKIEVLDLEVADGVSLDKAAPPVGDGETMEHADIGAGLVNNESCPSPAVAEGSEVIEGMSDTAVQTQAPPQLHTPLLGDTAIFGDKSSDHEAILCSTTSASTTSTSTTPPSNNTQMSKHSSSSLSTTTTTAIKAPTVRNAWGVLMGVEGVLSVLKALSEGV